MGVFHVFLNCTNGTKASYILSDKLYNVINIYSKSVWIKSYIYISGGLHVILEMQA